MELLRIFLRSHPSPPPLRLICYMLIRYLYPIQATRVFFNQVPNHASFALIEEYLLP